jgi:hypothetical protein
VVPIGTRFEAYGTATLIMQIAHHRQMTNGPGRECSVRVNQAIGMVTEQIHGTIPEAITLIAERATASGQMLDQIADAVIDRSIRFDG